MSYTNPLPGGTVGRTDQGVDVSAPAGTSILAITRERLVGVISNWYQGQPFYWFQELGKNNQPTGKYNYAAEQIQLGGIRPGQIVQRGQPIGVVAPSGTALEFGSADASGRTLAQDQGGYTEGVATQAGLSFRNNVFRRNTAVQAGVGGAGQTRLSQLWIDAGGSPALANTMAAIAMAESGGRVGARGSKNTNGTYDYGLWQINSSHGYDVNKLTTDPLYNAKAAVAIQKSQGLGAWSTYNSGAYRSYTNDVGAAVSGAYGGSRPGGSASGTGSSSASGGSSSGPEAASPILTSYEDLKNAPRTSPPNPAIDTALTTDVSFWGDLGNRFQWAWQQTENLWNTTESVTSGAVTAVQDTGQFLDLVGKTVLNPRMWLRALELIFGLIIMGFGLNSLTKRGNPIAQRANTVTSSLARNSPFGAQVRVIQGRARGRREAQTQRGVNQGRQQWKSRNP